MTERPEQEEQDVSDLAGTWSAALEALEADVAALDRAMEAGSSVAVSSWQAPQDLGPVPAELVPRAERLVTRIAEVRERGTERMGALRGELDELDRRREAGAAYSAASGHHRSN